MKIVEFEHAGNHIEIHLNQLYGYFWVAGRSEHRFSCPSLYYKSFDLCEEEAKRGVSSVVDPLDQLAMSLSWDSEYTDHYKRRVLSEAILFVRSQIKGESSMQIGHQTHNMGSDVPAGSIEMPRYRSHKTVWALKIATVTHVGESTDTSESPIVDLTFTDSQYAPMASVSTRDKPCPEAGWYFVRYSDGYYSFSPAKKFEEGHTLEAWHSETGAFLSR